MKTSLHRRDFLSLGSAAVLGGCFAPSLFAQESAGTGDLAEFVQVSKRAPRYFELTNGKPYIPIGLNMVYPPGREDVELTALENEWLKPLHENKANFIRVWLSHQLYEVERNRAGNFDPARLQKLKNLFALARKYGIRLKLCTEHFRHLGEGSQGWAGRQMLLKENGGPSENTRDYFTGEAGRAHYKKKLDYYAENFGSDPIVFGWELWNEMDAVHGFWQDADVIRNWSTEMLAELRKRFPKNLVMQSLGSYDAENKRAIYRMLCELPGNDVLQVHRYLDLGASWKICSGSVASLNAEATKDLLAMNPDKPVLLAEGGAVEPNHSGPFRLYPKDREGTILHDVLFAPFFVGAAGPGHIWHWDQYVARNNIWFHFGRFAAAVKGWTRQPRILSLSKSSMSGCTSMVSRATPKLWFGAETSRTLGKPNSKRRKPPKCSPVFSLPSIAERVGFGFMTRGRTAGRTAEGGQALFSRISAALSLSR